MSSSPYPVLVKKWWARAPSTSGGKDYHLILIQTTDDDGPGLVIMRWGKKDHISSGGSAVERFLSSSAAHDFFFKKYEDKSKRYVDVLKDEQFDEIDTFEDVREAIGDSAWNLLSPEDVNFIFPDTPMKSERVSDPLGLDFNWR